MIPRYKVQEIHDIWKTENKLNTWLKVELAHLESQIGNITNPTITRDEFNVIKENVNINIDRWKEIESETHHDVQAFVQMIEESIPDDSGRWLHYGLTSSDIIDTSLSLMCKESLQVVLNYASGLIFHLSKRLKSEESKNRILARTHGKAAEIQTYYDVIYRWLHLLRKGYDDVTSVKNKISLGKLSGATGNYKFNSIQCEYNALEYLGLKPVVSSQIIPRQHYLDYFYGILQLILAIEKIAYDIRIYSLDGINEMAEPFRDKQKGSSAMPHKKNPILTENICGLTRLYKSYFNTAIENCTTLLERDISHSSSERIIFKDSAHIACFTMQRLEYVIKNMSFITTYSESHCVSMEGIVDSQRKMTECIEKGMSRKEAHDIMQNNSDELYLESY
jgi:adenylosuccinate lyase